MIRTVENPIVTLEDVLPLYEAVGWTNYTTKPEMLEVAYKNSLHIIGAFKALCQIVLMKNFRKGLSD